VIGDAQRGLIQGHSRYAFLQTAQPLLAPSRHFAAVY